MKSTLTKIMEDKDEKSKCGDKFGGFVEFLRNI